MRKYLSIRRLSGGLSALFIGILLLNSCQKTSKSITSGRSTVKVDAAPTNAVAKNLSPAVALDWYKLYCRMILNANPATNNALNAESFGYMGIGLYESVRSGIKNSISLSNYLYQMPAMPQKDNNGYDLVVSANATLASIVRSMNHWLTPADSARIDSLENAYNNNFLLSLESGKFQRSQSYGRAVATAVLGWAKTDHFNAGNAGYVLPTTPVGVYIPTPPAYAPPIEPFVSLSRPLLIEDGSGVCPPPPYPYSEVPGSDYYNMVKDIYDVSFVLTPEQKTMALYWADYGIGLGYTPPGHAMNVVVEAIEQNGADLGTAAEALAKTGIAVREIQLTVFRSKYQYLQMRPVSYIRKVIDPNWLPLILTPAHPEYPAAHAYMHGAVMRTLSYVLGFNTPVTDHTYDFRGFAPRQFATFEAVTDECGNSRRYGGIHYMPSIVMGWSQGRAMGDMIGNIKLEQ